MRRYLVLATILVAALWAMACGGPRPLPGDPDMPRGERMAMAVEEGMTPAQVRSAIGRPTSAEKMVTGEIHEVWCYMLPQGRLQVYFGAEGQVIGEQLN